MNNGKQIISIIYKLKMEYQIKVNSHISLNCKNWKLMQNDGNVGEGFDGPFNVYSKFKSRLKSILWKISLTLLVSSFIAFQIKM